jgi:mono/diheme cytochrome c family protein
LNRLRYGLMAAGLSLMLVGCHTDMWQQPKTMPLDRSEFFPDRQGSRPLVPGTVPQGHLRLDTAFFTGIAGGEYVDELPAPLTLTQELLDRGQERFNIYCSPCHGMLGDGMGMISQRGLALRRPPATFHTERLRAMPLGHFYEVITNGYGVMFSYASRVEPEDRWAIAAYIRALQLSQHAPAGAADPQALAEADAAPAAAQGFDGGHGGAAPADGTQP